MRGLLFVLTGTLIAFLIGRLFSKSSQPALEKETPSRELPIPEEEESEFFSLAPESVFRLPRFGREPKPIEVVVTRRNRYETPDRREKIIEYICDTGDNAIIVKCSKSGRNGSITVGFECGNPTLSELGLTEDDLIAFDENQRSDFSWNGQAWRCLRSGEMFFFKNDGRTSKGFYSWFFESRSSRARIVIEKWENQNDFEVFQSWTIAQDDIEIFDAKRA